jgi:hypothetical protein
MPWYRLAEGVTETQWFSFQVMGLQDTRHRHARGGADRSEMVASDGFKFTSIFADAEKLMVVFHLCEH